MDSPANFSSDPAYQTGYVCGQWMVPLLCLIGAIYCIRLLGRPGVSRLCVCGLLTAMGSVGLFWLGPVIRGGGADPQTANAATAVVWMGILAAPVALLLSGIGLALYGPPATRGRGQAIWAIVLSVGIGGLGAGRVASTFREWFPEGLPGPRSPGATQTREDLNFTYTPPEASYAKVDPKALNSVAVMAFTHARPQVCMVIIAERLDAEMTSESLAALARANLQSVAPEARFQDSQASTVNGLAGVRFGADARIQGTDIAYAYWICARNGFGYQIMAWSARKDRDYLHREAPRIFRGFEQIDPDRKTGSPEVVRFGHFRGEALGFEVDLRTRPWAREATMETLSPHAECMGNRDGGKAYFCVIPVDLGADPVSLEALAGGLMRLIGPEGAAALKPGDSESIREQGRPGLRVRFGKTNGNTKTRHVVKVLGGPGRGYGIHVWAVEGADLDALAAEVFGAFRTFAPAGGGAGALDERQKVRQAGLRNSIGLYLFENKGYEVALGHFKAAAGWAPADKDYQTNVMNCLSRLGRNAEGLAWCQTIPTPPAEGPEVRSYKAFFLKELGRTDEAGVLYARLFREGYRDDGDFEAYVRMLAGLKRWPEVAAAFKDYLGPEGSAALRILEAELLHEKGDYAAAAARLEAHRRNAPLNAALADALIDNYDALGEHKKSLGVCEEMIARGLSSAHVYRRKARAEQELKWYRPAKLSLEKALELSPRDKETQAMLRDVSGLLGEGDNSSIKKPIDPVPLPAELAAAMKGTGAPAAEGYGSCSLATIDGIAYEPGASFKVTRRRRIRVDDAGGVSRCSTMEVHFDPLAEDVFVNDLLVTDAAGNVVSRGQLNDYYVIDRPGDTATHDKTLCMPVPSLQPGHTIEMTVTLRQLGPCTEFPFTRRLAALACPGGPWALYYLGPPTAIRHRTCAGAPAPAPIPGGLLWLVPAPMLWRDEPWQADIDLFVPRIQLADAKTTWPDLADKYLQSIQDKLAANSQAARLAAQSVKPADPPNRKILTLAALVQTTVTYKPIEFGRRSRIPNSPDQTLANKYGDCKDHAVLLQALLNAAGVTAHLALVNTAAALDPDLPSLDQFDHMIVFVPQPGGGFFLDPTDKDLLLDGRAPRGLAGRPALLLLPKAARFESVPAYNAASSTMLCRRTLRLGPGDVLHVQETLTASGYPAAFLRGALKDMDEPQRLDWIQSAILGSTSTVASFRHQNLYDNAKDLLLSLDYSVRGRLTRHGDDLTFKIPPVWERYLLSATPAAPRRLSPWTVRFPNAIDIQSRFELAPGHTLTAFGPTAPAGAAPGLQWRAQARSDPQALLLDFHAQLLPGLYPAKDYSSFQSELESAILSAGREVHLRAPAPTTAPATSPAP